MTDVPSIGELVREIHRLVATVDRLADRLDKMAVEHRQTYVPRELWDQARAADRAEVDDLQRQVKEAQQSRSRVLLAMASVAVTSATSVGVAIASVSSSGVTP